MRNAFVRSLSAAALLLLADGLAAQSVLPRAMVVPQIGATFHQSRSSDVTIIASLAAEVPVARGVSVMAEGMMSTTDYLLRVCFDSLSVCSAPTGLRSGVTAGLLARPFRLGRVAPYAGVSGGVARWARGQTNGNAPLASLRAGVDVQVAGPVGVRADLSRRLLWSDQADYSPVYADVLSLGASFSLRR